MLLAGVLVTSLSFTSMDSSTSHMLAGIILLLLGTRCIQNQIEKSKESKEYLKASIADLFTLFSSSVQNSEGGGDGDGGDSFADPCQEFKQGFLGVSSGLPLV